MTSSELVLLVAFGIFTAIWELLSEIQKITKRGDYKKETNIFSSFLQFHIHLVEAHFDIIK